MTPLLAKSREPLRAAQSKRARVSLLDTTVGAAILTCCDHLNRVVEHSCRCVCGLAYDNVSLTHRRENARLGKAVLGFTLLAAAMPGAHDALANSPGRWFAAPVLPNHLIFVQADAPKTEAILRKAIEDLQQEKPDFDNMEPELQKA